MIEQGLDLADSQFKVIDTELAADRDQTGQPSVMSESTRRALWQQQVIRGHVQNRTNPHERREIGLALTADVVTVPPLGEASTPGNFGVGRP